MRELTLPRLLVFLGLVLCLVEVCTADEADPGVRWIDVATLSIEGRGWTDTETLYDRLPARAKGSVRPEVWGLSQNSAGLRVGFHTDATRISLRWKLRSQKLEMPHMAATGVSGIDLYILDQARWRFLAVGRPAKFPTNQAVVADGLMAGQKEFCLYLPLYNGVEKVEIGIPEDAHFQAAAMPSERPLLFYGTSITQGGCASRPGMAYPAILGRRLNRPTINLGFSGNGKCEIEIAELLAELQPAAFVLDPLPNLETAQAVERLPKFIAKLRAARPLTPIVLVENVIYTNSPYLAQRDAKWRTSNEFLRTHYETLKAQGDQHVFLVPAADLLGKDGEATVDTVHPTDLGFLRMADTLEPILQQALATESATADQR